MSKQTSKTTPTKAVAENIESKPTHEFIGIRRYGSNDIGLFVLKDGVAVEVARDTYAIIEGKMRNELYRICFMESK
jgi:hypothetical protein